LATSWWDYVASVTNNICRILNICDHAWHAGGHRFADHIRESLAIGEDNVKMVELHGHRALPLNSRCIDRELNSWKITPERSALMQNSPNPFNPETWVPLFLQYSSRGFRRREKVDHSAVSPIFKAVSPIPF
jgi:hypothetical protein